MRTYLFKYLITISIMLFISACDDTSSTPNDTEPEICTINSECQLGETCTQGICIPNESGNIVIEDCQGENCDCRSDESCPQSSFCDLTIGQCRLIECQINSDCELGLTCLSNRCVIDLEADQDRDGIPDQTDNCPSIINSAQDNTDQTNLGLPGGPSTGDALGDACDDDIDNDGILNEVDNCLKVYNPDQRDSDQDGQGDGVGDRCEPTLVGACGDCPIDRIEGDILYCNQDCSDQARCVPDRARCNDNVREVCDQLGTWNEIICPGEENCEEVSETETRCVPRFCVPNSTSCSLDGTNILRCDSLGKGYEIDQACDQNSRCLEREDEYICLATICIDGDLRCNEGQLQRCYQDVEWRSETCPQRHTCGLVDGLAQCIQTVCGNGLVEAGETCDDSNLVTENCRYGERACSVCDATCQLVDGYASYCGDGLTNGEESCDDGNQVTEVCPYEMEYCEVCDVSCQLSQGMTSFCGDERIDNDNGEQCDDGNQLTETCPYGLNNYTCLICDQDCQEIETNSPFCGDRVVQEHFGEACDSGLDPNLFCRYGQDECTVCDANCAEVPGIISRCGDGVVDDQNEGCDDGNIQTEDCYGVQGGQCEICTNLCQLQTVTAHYCGDGVLQSDFETCDDGNTERSDGCDDLCRLEECGNEILQPWGGEECDDGNADPLDGCHLCQFTCGNERLDANEECDDGNRLAGDGCDESCLAERCGNGILQEVAGEQCDDGNTASADGCDVNCILEECGNGLVQAGEVCDDGNLSLGDGCDARCQLECGNGFRDLSEECDDGNRFPSDGCDAECQLEICGNGRIDHAEACDDGNTLDGDGCDASCLWETCGDEVLQSDFGEECDDGNEEAGDGCFQCLLEYCGNGRRDFGEACDSTELGCSATCELRPCAAVGCPDMEWALIDSGPITIGKPFGEIDPNSAYSWDYAWESALTPQRNYFIRGFYMAKTEVTIGQMKACIERGPCVAWGEEEGFGGGASWARRLSAGENQVIRGVPYSVMVAFSEWVGGRLPTELEWEFAARSRGAHQDFPWGADLPVHSEGEPCLANTHNCDLKQVSLPCSFPEDITEQGLCDMVGNVFEMTMSAWRAAYDHYSFFGESTHGSSYKVAKGLSYARFSGGYNEILMRVTLHHKQSWRINRAYSSVDKYLGFRPVIPILPRTAELSVSTCGDGELSPLQGEECDDGNTDLDYCPYGEQDCAVCGSTCLWSQGLVSWCGDGEVDEENGEECDLGLEPARRCPLGESSCTLCNRQCQSIEVVCGDGIIDLEHGEHCDDGNTDNFDGCDSNCRQEYCGNGAFQPHLGEECDDGNRIDDDGCSSYCYTDCGNGVIDPTELCDDGNVDNGDGCNQQCQIEVCGNGLLEVGEDCDDGNRLPGDGCAGDCQTEVCGNGSVQTYLGEECDDGNTVNGDGCDDLCQLSCGDGLIDLGENCDDGNRHSGDGCDDLCQIEHCGDGHLSLGERCDDGNRVDGDGCSRSCEIESCGDGVVQSDLGEECDDANEIDTDACYGCRLALCGDGVIRTDVEDDDLRYEECDDGGDADLQDGCHQCQLPKCGDGVTQQNYLFRTDQTEEYLLINEECDGQSYCTPACSWEIRALANQGYPPNMEWIYVEGGSISIPFRGENYQVTVPDFEISKTEVTVEQYSACIRAGQCTSEGGNLRARRLDHPVTVNWNNARHFATWVGGHLPSWSQWYYAATVGGQYLEHDPSIDDCELGDTKIPQASFQWYIVHSCNGQGTSPTCSFPKDHNALGLCDMYGNVTELLLDASQASGELPLDGSPLTNNTRCTPTSSKYYAGSHHHSNRRTATYALFSPQHCYYAFDYVGFRVVRLAKSWRRKRLPTIHSD